jgi:hypothetical protein
LNNFFSLLLAGLLSGTALSAILALLFHKRTTRIKEDVRIEFERGLQVFKSSREWKEQSVSELLGPMYMQFERTKRAAQRWKDKNLYLEGEIIRRGNTEVRDLLLRKAHLVPPQLLHHAGALVDHYDLWLEEFNKQRVEAKGSSEVPFVFVYNFPRDSEKAFRDAFTNYWDDLYKQHDNSLK